MPLVCQPVAGGKSAVAPFEKSRLFPAGLAMLWTSSATTVPARPDGRGPKNRSAGAHARTHIRVYTRAPGWAFPCIQNELRFQNEPSPENRFARGSGRPSRNGQAIVKNAIAGAAVSRIGKTFFSPQLISWRRKYRRSLRTGTAIFQRTPASTAGTHWHRRSGQAKCGRSASAQSPLRQPQPGAECLKKESLGEKIIVDNYGRSP